MFLSVNVDFPNLLELI